MINRMVIYSKGKKNLQITVPDNSPSVQTGKESRSRKWSRKPETEWRTAAAFLKRERPCPSGLVSQRLLAEGAEGAPAAIVGTMTSVLNLYCWSPDSSAEIWWAGLWTGSILHSDGT